MSTLKQYIGMPAETVVNILKNAGYKVVVCQSGVQQLLTCDYDLKRVVIEVCNNNVTNLSIG